jgi:subtilisin-like proprotein convertase family protein
MRFGALVGGLSLVAWSAAALADTVTLSNTAPIAIPDSGNASPYPSTITVPALSGIVSKVTVTLTGFTHTFPADVDVLLANPQGRTVVLLSDAGGGTGVSLIDLTFGDGFPTPIFGLFSGTFSPLNVDAGPDFWPAPAPSGPWGSRLADLAGQSPVGVWSLYVVDDAGQDQGSFSGWSITITTEPAGSWAATARMAEPRRYHSATLLPDGRVLAAGGMQDASQSQASAETYDQLSDAWTAVASMSWPRSGHSASLLPSGKVLVAGGTSAPGSLSELFEPATGSWTSAGPLVHPRRRHVAVRLASGTVVAIGGADATSGVALASVERFDAQAGTWSENPTPMLSPRLEHTATRLADGRILVVGGRSTSLALASAELYNPASGQWTATNNSLANARFGHTATLLPNGRVLIVGGENGSGVYPSVLSSCELFDPATGGFTAAGVLPVLLRGHSAVLLPDGRVLVSAGTYEPSDAPNPGTNTTAALYDPASDAWIVVGSAPSVGHHLGHAATLLPGGRVLLTGGGLVGPIAVADVFSPRSYSLSSVPAFAETQRSPGYSSTLLPDGRVLVAGGTDYTSTLASAETFNPATSTWTLTTGMGTPRRAHSATLLPSGRVLVAGGIDALDQVAASSELFDPNTGTWTSTGTLLTPRQGHTATLLAEGRVLVTGGETTLAGTTGMASAELYDPSTGTWTQTSPMLLPRVRHRATRLLTGKVLVTGSTQGTVQTEVFDPLTSSFSPTGPLAAPRSRHTSTLLPNGLVVVAGGSGGQQTAELYDPQTGRFETTADLNSARSGHSALALPDGNVLVAGGAYAASALEVFDRFSGTWTPVASGVTGASALDPVLLTDGRLLLLPPYYGAVTINPPAAGRRPLVTTASTSLSYDAPAPGSPRLSLTGTGFGGDSEAASGTAGGSAVDYPIVDLRSLDGGPAVCVPPDSRSSFADDPMTLEATNLPAGLNVGWHYLTVTSSGVPSVARLLSVRCGLAITGQPASVTLPVHSQATFQVTAQGAKTHQWQYCDTGACSEGDWNDQPGASQASYTTEPITGPLSGRKYRTIVQGACAPPAGQACSSRPEGCQASASATLTVIDSQQPAGDVVSPDGGEYWLQSETGAPPNTQLVSWTMSDDVRICQATVSLLYSTDGGTNYQAAPTGGGLPQTFGVGGSCVYPGVTNSNLTYTVPSTPPSGVAGSLYKIELKVSDQTGLPGHTVAVTSANPFYIVKANPDAVKTLILWHSARTASFYSGPRATALSGKLQEIAGHPRVQGLVVDLAGVTSLSSLYAAWDASPTDPSLANAVLFGAGGVHETVHNLLTAYSGVKHLVLAGDDRIIPFARLADHTTLLSESSYPDGSNLTSTGTTVGQALFANKYLSDDPLGVLDSITAGALDGSLYIPDLAVGRLVETPEEMITTIATFISQDGVLDVSALDAATGHKVLVTGYDFLNDAAKAVRDRWQASLGDPNPGSGAPVDAALIGDTWNATSVADRVCALRERLAGNGAQHYALMSLSGHATHFEEGVPGTDPFDIQGLDADAIAGGLSNGSCSYPGAIDLSGVVLYGVGCHAGLPVAGSSASEDHPRDLAQTFLSRGVVAYVANTGYGWGLRHGIGYGERLAQLATEELTKGGTVVIGDAVKRAKQRYYLETPRYDTYDEKSLMQWTLFGLPMYAVKTGIPTNSRPSLVSGSRLTAQERPAYEELGRVGVERVVETTASQPDYLTQINLHFGFTASGLYTKWTAAGDKLLPITLPCPDTDGCYYTLNGLADRATGAGDLPVQPYLIYDSRLAGTSQHGVLWKGGVYDEETNWIPVVGELISNGGDGSDHGSAPRLMFTRPTAPRLIPGLDPSTCRPSDLELNSLTIPAGEAVKNQDADPSYTIERRYRSIDLEALYFNNTLLPGQNCDRTGPALGAGPFGGAYHQVDGASITWAVPASDASGVWRVLVVVNDNATSGGQGVWSPLELTDNGSGTWVGSRAFGVTPRVTYVIQAVDNRGNVTWLDYVSVQAPSSGVPLGVPKPVDVGIGAPVGPAISNLTPARGPAGTTVRITGANLTSASEVTFGGVPAAITGNTPTLIKVLVPLGAVTGPVVVTTPAGTATSVPPFTVIPPAKLSITDVRVREGNSGQRNAVFRVTLTAPSAQAVTVDYAASDGTATAGSDYLFTSGTLTFRPFTRARTVSVPVLGDTAIEGNETFLVTLTSPSNATLSRAQGKATIVDDDR